MGYLLAALVLILAVAIAVAIAKLLFGLFLVAAGVVGAMYVWRRLSDDHGALTP